MAIVSQTYEFVLGVDTHAKNHFYTILNSRHEVVDSAGFPANKAGFARALSWAKRRTGSSGSVLWVVEGIATYGALLATAVINAGLALVEAPSTDKRARRTTGKSDPLDSEQIARAALPLDTKKLRQPRLDTGVRGALRTLIATRDAAGAERTAKINALTALVRRIDLGLPAARPLTASQIAAISRWHKTIDDDISITIAREEAIRLAKRIIALGEELAENKNLITALVQRSQARSLLGLPGVGPITAAVAYTVYSHPGRVHSEAAFAKIAGVNPLPASSGNTTRHRLNRSGDRRLNQALYMAAISCMRHNPHTREYVERRTSEGLTKREARRCVERYIARNIYRTLNQTKPLENHDSNSDNTAKDELAAPAHALERLASLTA